MSPVIHNFRVTKMLVDGVSSLNLLTAKVWSTLQIPLSRLQDMGAFQGVNGNVTRPRHGEYSRSRPTSGMQSCAFRN